MYTASQPAEVCLYAFFFGNHIICTPNLCENILHSFNLMFASLVQNVRSGLDLCPFDLNPDSFGLALQLEADKREIYKPESLAKRNVCISSGKGGILLSVRKERLP